MRSKRGKKTRNKGIKCSSLTHIHFRMELYEMMSREVSGNKAKELRPTIWRGSSTETDRLMNRHSLQLRQRRPES